MPSAKVTPCLWFAGNAEEAVNFYVGIFSNSKINHIQRYTESGKEFHGMEAGQVMVIQFELDGCQMQAINGPPMFKFTEAISLIIDAKDQNEVDHLYEKLGEGGDPAKQNCGWLADKYGLSWQIVPSKLKELMQSPDKAAQKRVNDVMLHSKKINLDELQKAHDQES